MSVPLPTVFPHGPARDTVPDPPLRSELPLDFLGDSTISDLSLTAPLDLAAETQDSSSEDGSPTPDYSIRERDRDLSRGMGHHLRWQVPASSPGDRRRHSRTTSDTPQVVPALVPPASASPVPRPDLPRPPEPSARVLRPRRPLSDVHPCSYWPALVL